MAEISLILTAQSSASDCTAIAVADSGVGISAISGASIKSLLQGRDRIVDMMHGSPRMPSNELRAFGRAMGSILFSDEVRETCSAAKRHNPVVTKLLATTPALKAVPWEYAALPDGCDGPDLLNSVVRLVPQTNVSRSQPLPINGPLKIVLFSASPSGLSIPWSSLRDTLLAVFSAQSLGLEVIADGANATSDRYIRIVEAASRQAIRHWAMKDKPHVIHFVGHGTAGGITLVDSKSRSASTMTAVALQGALKGVDSVRLLLLSACDTANNTSITPIDATVGVFAEQVVRNVVPAVIASQTVIDKRCIALFCEGLYPELSATGSIDKAVAAGRCRIAQEIDQPASAAIEWGIPVLYRRLYADRL